MCLTLKIVLMSLHSSDHVSVRCCVLLSYLLTVIVATFLLCLHPLIPDYSGTFGLFVPLREWNLFRLRKLSPIGNEPRPP